MDTKNSLSLRQVLHFSGVVLLVTVLLGYIIFQARNILQGPTLSLTEVPASPVHTKSILLSGTAHNIVKLTLNGKEIHTNKVGAFSQELVLEKGYTVATLWAQDRFGRTTMLSETFVFVENKETATTTRVADAV